MWRVRFNFHESCLFSFCPHVSFSECMLACSRCADDFVAHLNCCNYAEELLAAAICFCYSISSCLTSRAYQYCVGTHVCRRLCNSFLPLLCLTPSYIQFFLNEYCGDAVSGLARPSLGTELHRAFRSATNHLRAANPMIENLFITPTTCPTRTFFPYEPFFNTSLQASFPVLGKWTRGSEVLLPSLKIRVPGVCYATAQL